MGLNGRQNDTAATPGRKTIFTWDWPATGLSEPAWSYTRSLKQIAPVTHNRALKPKGVMQLASGYWGLMPYAREVATISERTDGAPGIITSWAQGGQVQAANAYRPPTDLPHATDGASPNLRTTPGDSFLTIRRAAGEHWNLASLPAPPVLSFRPVTAPETATDLPMITGAIAQDADPEDTGYLLRWVVPGSVHRAPDVTFDFYFGGPLDAAGFGQFALRFRGSGLCELYEYGNGAWQPRKSWRYAEEGQVVNRGHTMRIIPHAGKFIEFQAATTSTSIFTTAFQPGAGAAANQAETYIDARLVTGRDKGYRYMTGRGQARWSHRQDLRGKIQVARLLYPVSPETGVLYDQATIAPFPLQSGGRLDFAGIAWKAPGTDVAAIVYNGDTLAPLAGGGDTWQLPGGKNAVFVGFSFTTTDSYHSPWLKSYRLAHPQTLATNTPAAFSGGTWERLRIDGPDAEPSHESGTVVMQDRGGELTKLGTRAEIPVKIETQYDPAHPELRSVLFQGYTHKVVRHRRGAPGLEAFGKADWSSFDCRFIGMWQRLFEQRIFGQEDEWVDTAVPLTANGNYQPRKVTDVIREFIGKAGFPDTMIDVPDNPMRLWRAAGDSDDIWAPMPFDTIGDYVTMLARDYLGGYWFWDANASPGGAGGPSGTNGMIRLKLGARAGTPLWHFVTTGPAEPMRLFQHPKSYPANTSPVYELESWPEKPDGNVVVVTSTGEVFSDFASATAKIASLANPDSFNWPGGPGRASPDHPDYLGRMVPILVADPQIPDQNACNWMCRRYYNIACRSFQAHALHVPLVLVTDPTDTRQRNPRPLRHGDTVTLDGVICLVRSATIQYESDEFQSQRLELQQSRTDDR
jgi:hypothetical protein